MMKLHLGCMLLLLFQISILSSSEIYLPIDVPDRKEPGHIIITEIGAFGVWRVDRPGIPGHFHTGIDIKRPADNYSDENIFPISDGIVISMRDDGPYAQLILEHVVDGRKIWSLYEHISGIQVQVGDSVRYDSAIARFMNREELNTYGWQFNHFHFEIIKIRPMTLKVTHENPQRFFNSYTLICHKAADLQKYFYNPLDYLFQNMEE